MTTQFRVPDASCGHCKSAIESSVTELGDVARADLDLATNVLTVEHEGPVDSDRIALAIERAGYTPEPVA